MRRTRATLFAHKVSRRDRRFQLVVKTKMPCEYPWVWANAEEQALTNTALERIRDDADFRRVVAFDRFGADVGNWLLRVGFVLSSSDDESFHLAPAEGKASDAMPVIINWAGREHHLRREMDSRRGGQDA